MRAGVDAESLRQTSRLGRQGRCFRSTHRILVRLIALTILGHLSPCPGDDRRVEPSTRVLADSAWPQFRGPSYSGVSLETGLANSWPPEGPPALWVRDLGQGFSSFACRGERIYTQMQTLLGQYLVCLDAGTGKTLWEHRYGFPYEAAGLYPGPRATPTVREGRVYFAAPDGLIGCVDAINGQPIWSVNVNKAFHGRGTDFGYAASPVVEDGKVIVPVGGKGASVVALSADEGTLVWSAGNEPASYSSVLPISFQGRRLVVAILQNALVICDLKTGVLLSQLSESEGYDEHAAAPLYVEPCLLIASPFRNGAKLYRLETPTARGGKTQAAPNEPAARIELRLAWQTLKLSNDVASSVCVEGNVYGFDLREVQSKAHRPSRGEFRCLHWQDGKVRWSTEVTGHCTIMAADQKLILFNDRGQLLLIRASPDEYRELARTDVFGDEICWTAPALDQKRLFVRTHSRAACLYLGPPEELARTALAQAIPASQIPKSISLNWMSLLGREREYLFDPPTRPQLLRWYLTCVVGVFGTAGLVALSAGAVINRIKPGHLDITASVVFWILAFVLGLVTTPIGNSLTDEYIFTWPATLFATYQPAITASVRYARSSERSKRLLARGAGLSLCAVCAAYFWLCRRLSLHHEWAFLMGLLPAFPMSIVVARASQRPLWRRAAWGLVAFSVFFWSAGGWMIVRASSVR
jgi:hypothetical protein